MSEEKCADCGAPLDAGFLSTTNGSGLYWSHDASSTRLRPVGLEVVVGTGFSGTYSANLGGTRCTGCGAIHLRRKKP
ncbi:MAG: hypothetical protein L3K19_09045 [Thermoplasmata archaeon]|nr:hypothetical protein [Thermoplasmata archaeon]